MATKETIYVRILKVEKLNNSYFGNPRCEITFMTDDFSEYSWKTTPNSIAGYKATETIDKFALYEIEFHQSRNNFLIDKIQKVFVKDSERQEYFCATWMPKNRIQEYGFSFHHKTIEDNEIYTKDNNEFCIIKDLPF